MRAIAELLAQGQAHYCAGRLQHAEQSCRQVLAVEPANADALFICGMACYAAGQLEGAAESLGKVVCLEPQRGDAQHYLGLALAHLGRLNDAIASLERAARLNPTSVEIAHHLRCALAAKHINRGMQLTEQGRFAEAAGCHRQALELIPDHPGAYEGLAFAHLRQNQLCEAVACFRRVVELTPDDADAHHKLALALVKHNRLDDAVACFGRALTLQPGHAETHNNLATALVEQDRFEEAVACYRRAVELKPDYGEAHYNLGLALVKQNNLEEATACYRRALDLMPGHAEAYNNLAIAHGKLDRVDDAITCYRRAIALKPDYAEAHYNLGIALASQNRSLDEAMACYRRAAKLKQDYADPHFGHALALLTTGRFAEGWPEYEWRVKCKGMELEPLSEPRWTGEPLAGKTILLRREQGLGDSLQFVRYAEMLKQQGATVIVECWPQLARLLATCRGVDRIVTRGERLPRFDVHAPLLSLPGLFQASLENIPARVPYLAPDQSVVERWRQELGHCRDFKIGIAWQGNPANSADRFRSFPVAQFADLAAMRGVRLYSIQMGAGREQLACFATRSAVTDLGDRLGDFHDTAAIMCGLDLVITCDSAPAHLAGALGVPVWVALSYAPDWRWMLDRQDTPWYPTMRLFRQDRPHDWDGVFRQIQVELAGFCRAS